MTYEPTDWQDAPSTATPLDAARLNNMEAGIVAAQNPPSQTIRASNADTSPEIQHGTFPCDGARHNLTWNASDPGVDWMDDQGRITKPGLYNTYVYVSTVAELTTPNQSALVLGFYYSDATVDLDALWRARHQAGLALDQISFSVDDASLPYQLYESFGPAIFVPTDETGQVAVATLIERVVGG